MYLKFVNKTVAFAVLCVIQVCFLSAQNIRTIEISTSEGHHINRRSSGFNVRIADKVWSYTHPDFVKAVEELKPGWLRYFSGTMGDAFSSATGQYDLDYIAMFEHQKQYVKGHRFVKTKGPHRLVDLYDVLSNINGKLIVTVNAFSETPEMILELARFCKNNNIKVEVWQFCNEPYFYTPNRDLYWWNDGYDYAAKMQPYAEVIRQVYPDAKLTLNYTWDGVWTFMKEIHKFQEERGAYWNTFSKHSYAPHIGRKQTLEQAYKRANTRLIEATSSIAMSEIEDYTWKDVPMVITEFGVWNKPLNGIYSSIYNIEYVMRQLEHENTQYVGAHEVSSKYFPLHNKKGIIEDAYTAQIEIDTDTLLTGINRDLEGKAYSIFHEATNNSDYLYATKVIDGVKVPGLKNTNVNGMFAQTYKGSNGYNYLVVSNRSGEVSKFKLEVDGEFLNKHIHTTYISGDSLSTKEAEIQNETFKNGVISIKPYSISVGKWKSKTFKLEKPTIYKASIEKDGILLNWGTIDNSTKYRIHYGTDVSSLNKTIDVGNENSFLVKDVVLNKSYVFKITAHGKNMSSELSDSIFISYKLPEKTEVFKVSRRDETISLFWKSVPNTTGYLIGYKDEKGRRVEINAGNVFGYRIEDLKDNVKYEFELTAYNGLGKGQASNKVSAIVSSRVPLSPRNVSAIKKTINSVEVKWIPQKKVLSNTCYNVYRGEKLHEFVKIASCVHDTLYIDNSIEANTPYYYTVKALTDAGESNFHPNIATAFSAESSSLIKIRTIESLKEGYLVKVDLNGITVNQNDVCGVIINNISYLNVEHLEVLGVPEKDKPRSFKVFIPKSKVKSNSNYAIKAFVKNQGKLIESAIVNQRTMN